VIYKGWLDSKEKRAAEDAALRNAVETWYANQNAADFRNYERVKPEIDADIDNYVLNYQVLDQAQDKEQREYRVVVRAELNEPRLQAKLLSATGHKLDGNQEYITFVFVAREQVGTSSKSGKRSTQSKTSEKSIGRDNDSADSASITKTATKTISQIDESMNYTDKVLWDVSTTNEVNVAMGDVFTDANYLVIDADLLEEETDYLLEVASFVNDYRYGDDVGGTTRRNAIKGLKSLEDPVQYLAIGTLDISQPGRDEQTGNLQVSVSVTAQVLSVSRRGAAVAKVGPVQYRGEGTEALMARNNGLKLAAREVASALVAKLNSRNIR
jgi:hypothetical protein